MGPIPSWTTHGADNLRRGYRMSQDTEQMHEKQPDLDTLRLGARRETGLLEWLLGLYEKNDGPPESERAEAARRLANRWDREWKLFDPELAAARLISDHEGRSVAAVKRDALYVAIFQALGEAHEPKLTKISHDRAMAVGSRIVLRQESPADSDELIISRRHLTNVRKRLKGG